MTSHRIFDKTYEIGDKIGQGAFSTVRAVKLRTRLGTPSQAPNPSASAAGTINSSNASTATSARDNNNIATASNSSTHSSPITSGRPTNKAAAALLGQNTAAAAAPSSVVAPSASLVGSARRATSPMTPVAVSTSNAAAASDDQQQQLQQIRFAAKIFIPQSVTAQCVSPARMFGLDEPSPGRSSQNQTPIAGNTANNNNAGVASPSGVSPCRGPAAAAAAAAVGGGGGGINSTTAAAAVAATSSSLHHRRYPSSSDRLDRALGAADVNSGMSTPREGEAAAGARAVAAGLAAAGSNSTSPITVAAAAAAGTTTPTRQIAAASSTNATTAATATATTIHAAFQQAAVEAHVLASAPEHPNLLCYHEAFLDEDLEPAPVIITELARGRELFQIFSERQHQQQQQQQQSHQAAARNSAPLFSEAEVKVIAAQLFSALAALHDADIIHRDVKLENLVYCEQTSRLTLVDFGLAVFRPTAAVTPVASSSPPQQQQSPNSSNSNQQKPLNTVCGSPHYVSPEMLKAARFSSSATSTPVHGPAAGAGGGGGLTMTPTSSSLMLPPTSSSSAAAATAAVAAAGVAGMSTPTSSGNFAASGMALFRAASSSSASYSAVPDLPFSSSNKQQQQSGSAAAAMVTSPTASAPSPSQQHRNSLTSNSNNNGSFPSLPSKLSGTYGKEIDVWAAGVVVYVLIEGRYPFHDERRLQWHRSVIEGNYRSPVVASESARAFFRRVFEVDPRRRCTAAVALCDPFFAGVNVTGLVQKFQLEREQQYQQQQQQQMSSTSYASTGSTAMLQQRKIAVAQQSYRMLDLMSNVHSRGEQ